jgi:hypothetical protein
MPTAKDAGTILGPLISLVFVPFYAVTLILRLIGKPPCRRIGGVPPLEPRLPHPGIGSARSGIVTRLALEV